MHSELSELTIEESVTLSELSDVLFSCLKYRPNFGNLSPSGQAPIPIIGI
jgi:hypothetical protein